MMRVMKCSQGGCLEPATWKTGTWWACDEHIKSMLFNADMFDAGEGHTLFGSSYRLSGYAKPDPGMNDEWLELTTVEEPCLST